MNEALVFAGILAALLLGAVSPGPSFILVSRIALSQSRRAGVFAALGMGLGSALFAVLALIGLVAVLVQVPWLYLFFKVAGGLYLLFLCLKIWRGSRQPLDTHLEGVSSVVPPPRRAIFVGMATQIANPKTAVVYASIFASMMPIDPSWTFLLLIPLATFLIEAGWYATVACLLAAPAPKSIYLRWKVLWDRTAALCLGALGARFAFGELR